MDEEEIASDKRRRHRREEPEEDRRKIFGVKNYTKALLVVKANKSAKKVLIFAVEFVGLAILVGLGLFLLNRNGDEWAEKFKVDSEVSLPAVTANVPDKDSVTPTVDELPDDTSVYTWTPEGSKDSITFLYPFEWEPLAEIVDGKQVLKEFVSSNNESLLITYRTASKPTAQGLKKVINKQFSRWNKSEPVPTDIQGKYRAVITAQSRWKKQSLKRYVGGYIAQGGYFILTLTYQDSARASDISPQAIQPIVTSANIE